MSAAVRSIHLPGTSALQALASRARDSLVAWASRWVIGWAENRQCLQTLQAEGVSPSDVEPSEQYERLTVPAGSLWIRCNPADRLRLGRAVVGPHLMPRSVFADDWVVAAVDQAWRARNRALCAVLLDASVAEAPPTHRAAPADNLFAFGSGAVKLTCEQLGLHLLGDPAVWKSIPPVQQARTRLAKPVPLEQALSRASVHLDVMLGSVEVPVSKVVDLRSGDVLRLPQRLDEPVTVHCHGLALASAMLGASNGRKVVQLAPQDE